MSIVNVTPDSFSDGSRLSDAETAFRYASQCLDEGADILDIGGESTRPFAEPVPLEEEWTRVGPVLELLHERLPVAIVSIDTRKPEIARRALASGARIVNDITGCDPQGEMPHVVAEAGAGIVIMHMQGTPETMQVEPKYQDVVGEILDFLADRVRAAMKAGIPAERIAIDPGIGFGKTLEQNLEILRSLDRFRKLGHAVLIGTSRKRMIGELTGRGVSDRTSGSVASVLFAASRGAAVARVHDVAATVDALRVWHALEQSHVG
ncbi:dihydropteroate synthase [bacterium]|nr:dihydropteroate synthase [bacterium]